MKGQKSQIIPAKYPKRKLREIKSIDWFCCSLIPHAEDPSLVISCKNNELCIFNKFLHLQMTIRTSYTNMLITKYTKYKVILSEQKSHSIQILDTKQPKSRIFRTIARNPLFRLECLMTGSKGNIIIGGCIKNIYKPEEQLGAMGLWNAKLNVWEKGIMQFDKTPMFPQQMFVHTSKAIVAGLMNSLYVCYEDNICTGQYIRHQSFAHIQELKELDNTNIVTLYESRQIFIDDIKTLTNIRVLDYVKMWKSKRITLISSLLSFGQGGFILGSSLGTIHMVPTRYLAAKHFDISICSKWDLHKSLIRCMEKITINKSHIFALICPGNRAILLSISKRVVYADFQLPSNASRVIISGLN